MTKKRVKTGFWTVAMAMLPCLFSVRTAADDLLGAAVYVDARQAMAEGRLNDAVKEFQTLITVESPLIAYVHYWQGVCLNRQSRRGAAVDAFFFAIEVSSDTPVRPHAQLALGDIYLSNKTYKHASTMYRNALLYVPTSIDVTYARYQLARALAGSGDLESACAELRLIRSTGRTPPEFFDEMVEMMDRSDLPADRLHAARWLYSSGEYTRAAKACIGIIEKASEDIRVRREAELLRGKSMSRAGQAGEAARMLHDIAERHKGSVTASQAMLEEAGARRRVRQTTAFIDLTGRLAEMYPQSQAAETGVLNVAKAYEGWGDHDKARDWYARFARDFSWSWSVSEALHRRAVLGAVHKTDTAAAEKEFAGIIDQLKSRSYRTAANFWHGKLRLGTGNTHGASVSFSTAARLKPYSYYGLRARGAIAAMSGGTVPADALKLTSDFVLLAPQPPAVTSDHQGYLVRMPEPAMLRRIRQVPQLDEKLDIIEMFAREDYDEVEWELVSLGTMFGAPDAKWALACVLHNAGAHYRAIRLAESLDAIHGSAGNRARLVFPTAFWTDVQAAASRFGADPFLVEAIMREESRFKRGDISTAGAIGLMQLMPATAKWIADKGVIDKFSADQTADPPVNITLGTWYIANLVKRFDGNIVCAIAGYNAGPGNVDKWVRANGPVFSDVDAFIEKIPFEETREYVKRVLRSYATYRMLYGRVRS